MTNPDSKRKIVEGRHRKRKVYNPLLTIREDGIAQVKQEAHADLTDFRKVCDATSIFRNEACMPGSTVLLTF